jgi:hypothetical protein
MGSYWGNALLGLSGVFFGALCFRTRHRFVGSVILLAGGVAIDGFFEDSGDNVYPFSVVWVALGGLIPVAIYGLLAVITNCRRSQPNSQSRTNGWQPVSSDNNSTPGTAASRRSP